MARITLFLLSLLFATVALAQSSIDGWSNCPKVADLPGAAASSTTVGPTGKACFDFDSGFSTGASTPFTVTSRAKVCLNADRNGTAGAAVVDIQDCTGPDDAGTNACSDTGLTLTASNRCEAVVRGVYRLEVTTGATGTEDAQVAVQGY